MSFKEKCDNLYEELRLNIIRKVKEIGKDSHVGFKTIKIEDEDFHFTLSAYSYLVEIGEDYLFNKYGHSYDFSALYIEDLCELVDYLNTLK